MVYKFFDKKSALFADSRVNTKLAPQNQQQLAEELHKPIIKKFEERKVQYKPHHYIKSSDTTCRIK